MSEDRGGAAPTPTEINTSIAHPARVYDVLLGGKDNYAADREVAEQLLKIVPDGAAAARSNRAFVLRAVRHVVAEHGIDQIVDLGAGIPSLPTVHGVAREIDPDVVVGYVDNDPIVLAHDRALLAVEPGVRTAMADLTDPDSVFDAAELATLIDWSRPVAVVFASVLHFLTDDRDPVGLVAAYRDRLAPGSVLIISMGTTTGFDPAEVARIEAVYRTSQPVVFRPHEQIAAFFTGTTLLEPGLVPVSQWRPDGAEGAEATEWVDRLRGGIGLVS